MAYVNPLFSAAELANIAAWNVRDAVFKDAQKSGSSDPTAAGSSAYDKALAYYSPPSSSSGSGSSSQPPLVTSIPKPVAVYTPPPVPVYTPPVPLPVPVITPQPVQVPQGTSGATTPYPTGNVSQGTQVAVTAKDERRNAMNRNIWSNDPTIANLEMKSWAIYVETGRWDSAEQKQYHDQAEAVRKSINPLIPRTPDGSGEVGKILPTDQFPTTNGMDTKGLITLGAGGLFLVIIMSMFRR